MVAADETWHIYNHTYTSEHPSYQLGIPRLEWISYEKSLDQIRRKSPSGQVYYSL